MVARREKLSARERPYAPDPPGFVLEKGLPPTHPQRCYAHKHNGRRCGRLGVNGSGRCSVHGGRQTGRGTNLYARHTRGKLKEAIKEFEDMPDPKNLRGELVIARALLSRYLEQLKKKKSNPLKFQSALSRSIELVGSIAERLSKMEDGLKIHLDLKQAEMLVHAVMNAVNDCVPDEKIRAKIADKLSNIKLMNRGAA